MRKIDITGRDFGFLHVNYYNKEVSKEKGKSMWNCTCCCGNTKDCESYELRNGKAVSCGCRTMDRPHVTHGKTNTEIYRKWQSMKGRCNNPNFPHYSYYGGRGISVCKEWESDFSAFYDWSIQNGYKDGLSIDRIDCNGNYEPSNCRWIPIEAQQRNKRDTVRVCVDGVTKPLQEWAELSGVSSEALRERYRKGKKYGIENFSNSFLRSSTKGVTKMVLQSSCDGEPIKLWVSAKSVCEELHLTESTLRKCCRGEKKQYKGYIWKYSDCVEVSP